VRRYVKRYYARLIACYETELQREPDLASGVAVTVAFVIAEAGTSESVTVSSRDATLTSCVVATVERMRFPAAPRATTVSYTLVYSFTD
jgi:hypothetical protein